MDATAEYALCVSFEALDGDIPIYIPIRNAVQTMIEVEERVEEVQVRADDA